MSTSSTPRRQLRGRPSKFEQRLVAALDPANPPVGHFDRIIRAIADDVADRVAQRVSEVLAAAAHAQLAAAPSRDAAPADWLDTRAAAERMNLRPKTLEEWRREGKGPPFVRISDRIRYNAHVLDTFVASGAGAKQS